MATQIVKSLQFPGSDDLYQINAVYLEGLTRAQIEERFDGIESFDALRYMGVISSEASELPAANKGDVYKITFKGTLNDVSVEPGDMVICNTDKTAAGNIANWDIIQTNIDVDAILDHYHQGTVEFTKINKNLTHDVDYTKENITAEFKNGEATITTKHNHTASGSVSITAEGTNEVASITPAGTVTIGAGSDITVVTAGSVAQSAEEFLTSVSVDSHAPHAHTGTTQSATDTVNGTVTISKGTGAVNYTPDGTIANSTTQFVTEVHGADTTISAHTADSEVAGGFTPAGTVTVKTYTPEGSVTGSVSVDSSFTSTSGTSPVMSSSVKYTAAGKDNLDSILEFGTQTVVTSVSGTVKSNATPELNFEGNSATITATFSGTPVAAHKHVVTVADHEAFKPQVTVSTAAHNHTFQGTGANLAATFSGSIAGHTHTFTSSEETLTHSVSTQASKHMHDFNATTAGIGATFKGTAATHTHTFNGGTVQNDIVVTVNDNTTDLVGTVTGDVELTNATNVVKGVIIGEHAFELINGGTVVTGSGLVRE